MGQTTFFTDPAECISFLMRGDKVVSDINVISDNMVRVRHTDDELFVEGLCNTNVAIAAFTTAYARLELYGWLEQLQERALYMDTGEFRVDVVEYHHFLLLFV